MKEFRKSCIQFGDAVSNATFGAACEGVKLARVIIVTDSPTFNPGQVVNRFMHQNALSIAIIYMGEPPNEEFIKAFARDVMIVLPRTQTEYVIIEGANWRIQIERDSSREDRRFQEAPRPEHRIQPYLPWEKIWEDKGVFLVYSVGPDVLEPLILSFLRSGKHGDLHAPIWYEYTKFQDNDALAQRLNISNLVRTPNGQFLVAALAIVTELPWLPKDRSQFIEPLATFIRHVYCKQKTHSLLSLLSESLMMQFFLLRLCQIWDFQLTENLDLGKYEHHEDLLTTFLDFQIPRNYKLELRNAFGRIVNISEGWIV